MIITIDGPAGAGKSTVAKTLARRLNVTYLDTGAMYRALTLKALREGLPLEYEQRLVELAQGTTLDLKSIGPGELRIYLDGEDVSEEIRSSEVTNNTFYIARAPRVRQIMVDWQRRIGRKTDTVVEGRDIGTVVFPDAQYKFYLDADFEERARRRIKELRDKGKPVNDGELKDELQDRDHKDFTRTVGPLKQAADAVRIDSTGLSVDEVVAEILRHIKTNKNTK